MPRRNTSRRTNPSTSQRRAASSPAAPPSVTTRQPLALGYAALLLAVLFAYARVWHGGVLWDDEAHLTPETLRSWSGLGRLWFDVGSSQQYYPVVNTAFWTMAQLWGDNTLGYHLVNITLHATSAFLVVLILRRLHVPGAWLAGAIFALHPVYVESVAWMSELKNTLSGVLYLSALFWYLRFDEDRSWRNYTVSLALFGLALGSKTVTASLPAAILIILWWQRGRLQWRDATPLAPFFLVGLAGGLTTAVLEYKWVGAHGAEFDLSLLSRSLLAGRVIWFYAASIVWPFGFSFSYPRWIVDPAAAWQYVFPAGVLIVLAALALLARRSRAPLAATLFFIVTLFPALGFVNVYPFRYSYVADHFQYLASLGLVVLIAAGVTIAFDRWRRNANPLAAVVPIAAVLAVLTFQYSQEYVNAETLYRATLRKNPNALLARTNLSALLLEGPREGWAEGLEHAEAAVRINPDGAPGHQLRGVGLMKSGALTAAVTEFRESIRIDPGRAETHYSLGIALDGLGQYGEAIASYERALQIYPRNAAAMHNLANALKRVNRTDEAISRLKTAVAIDPASPEIRLNLADTLTAAGALEPALDAYREALRLRPEWGEAWNNYGLALRKAGRLEEATPALENAVRWLPKSARAQVNLAALLVARGRLAEAVPYMEQAIRLTDPAQAATLHDDTGLLLMQIGDRARALPHFEAAIQLDPNFTAARQHLAKAR